MSSRRLLLAAGLLLFMAGCQTDSAEIAGTSEPDTTVGAAGVATTMPESPTPRANESSSSNGELIQHGAMHEVIGQQKHHGRILLAEAIKRPNLFAVGALEGLEGEITVYDGKVLATEVAEAPPAPRDRVPPGYPAGAFCPVLSGYGRDARDRAGRPRAS